MDPIADLIVKIKNAQKVGRETVETPYSNIKFELLKILERENFVGKIERKGSKPKEKILVNLKYEQGVPAIHDLKRVSKPGQRVYAGAQKIRPVRQGYGLAVISTSRGLMTNKEAKKEKLGGEILFEVI